MNRMIIREGCNKEASFKRQKRTKTVASYMVDILNEFGETSVISVDGYSPSTNVPHVVFIQTSLLSTLSTG